MSDICCDNYSSSYYNGYDDGYDKGYKEGFQDGLHRAAELVKAAKPSRKDLSSEEWIAVELTHEAIVKAILYNGLSN